MKHSIVRLILGLSISFLDINPAFCNSSPKNEKTNEEIIQKFSNKIEKLNRKELTDLAKAYSTIGNSTGAIKAYTAILAIAPKSPEVLTAIGAEQIKMGKESDGKQTLKSALEINKKYFPAYRHLIKLYEDRKNRYELRMIYTDLVLIFGKKPEYITNLCDLTTTEGLYDQAKEHCESGMKLNPKEPKNFINMGLISRETGNDEDAENRLKTAADQFPNSELALITYAQDQDQKKNFVVSYNYYKKTIALNPSSTDALLGLATASFEIQKYQEALDIFTKACSLDIKTLSHFRKATNTLRLMKNADWLSKFEVAQQVCGIK